MENEIINLWGEPIEVAISSSSTNHASCTVIQTSPPRGGTMVHMHTREDEVLIVLEGEYAFYNGESWLKMHPGEPFYGVRNRPHAYRNVGTTQGRMLVVAAPGGLEEYFAAVAPLSPKEEAAKLNEISRMFGVTVLPPGTVPDPEFAAWERVLLIDMDFICHLRKEECHHVTSSCSVTAILS